MPQYCRYCCYCFESDDFRCSNHPDGKEPHWTRAQINRANNCPNFALSDLGDVETGRPYRPRKRKRDYRLIDALDAEQIRMEME